jgi:hypothetical protein
MTNIEGDKMMIKIDGKEYKIRMTEFTTEELVEELKRRQNVEHICVYNDEQCEIAVERLDDFKEYVGKSGIPSSYKYDKTFSSVGCDILVVKRG